MQCNRLTENTTGVIAYNQIIFFGFKQGDLTAVKLFRDISYNNSKEDKSFIIYLYSKSILKKELS